MIALCHVIMKMERRGSVERTTHYGFGSRFALLLGLVTAVAATVAVMTLVKHDGIVATGLSDDWDEITGM